MQGKVLKIRIQPKKIAYLKFILEGYSHLTSLTVENPKEGIVSLHFYPSEENFLIEILKFLEIEACFLSKTS